MTKYDNEYDIDYCEVHDECDYTWQEKDQWDEAEDDLKRENWTPIINQNNL